jgi:hypothetical protein
MNFRDAYEFDPEMYRGGGGGDAADMLKCTNDRVWSSRGDEITAISRWDRESPE